MLNRRPLFFFSATFLVVLFVSCMVVHPIKIILAPIFLISGLCGAFLCRKRGNNSLFFMFIAVSFALLLSYVRLDIGYTKNVEKYSSDSSVCECVITDIRYDNGYSGSYECTITAINDVDVNFRAILSASENYYLDIGDRIVFESVIEPSVESTTLDGYYYLAKGFYFILTPSGTSFEIVSINDSIHPFTDFAHIGQGIYRTLLRYLPKDSAAMICALLCADKSKIDYSFNEGMSLLGISHILAVSGLHLGILAGVISLILSKFRLGKRVKSIIVLIACFAYVLMCSCTLSVLRAFGMLSIFMLSSFSMRKRDTLTSLLFSVAVICTLSPFAIVDIGLIMSFLSTLGIIVIGVPLTRSISAKFKKPVAYILNTFAITYAANIALLPVFVFIFGNFSLASPIANLIFIPIFTILLYISPLLLIFSGIPMIAAIIAYPTKWLCSIITCLATQDYPDFITVTFDSTAIKILCIIVYILIWIVVICLPKVKIIPMIIALLYITVSIALQYLIPKDYPEYITCSDGINDALILCNDSKGVLIANSNGGYSFLSDSIILANEYGIEIDTIILTHYHYYLQSGISKLLDRYDIENVLIPEDDDFANICEKIDGYTNIVRYGNSTISYRDWTVYIDTCNIDRSVHDCIRIEAANSSESIVFVGTGYIESDNFNTDIFYKCDCIIFGSHGPSISETIALDRDISAKIVCLGEEKLQISEVLPSYTTGNYVKFAEE